MFLFYMPEEIEGRELSARFRQGQLYIPKFYTGMYNIREGDYFVLKVIRHSHASNKHRVSQNNRSNEKSSKSEGPNFKPQEQKSAKLNADDEPLWDEEE